MVPRSRPAGVPGMRRLPKDLRNAGLTLVSGCGGHFSEPPGRYNPGDETSCSVPKGKRFLGCAVRRRFVEIDRLGSASWSARFVRRRRQKSVDSSPHVSNAGVASSFAGRPGPLNGNEHYQSSPNSASCSRIWPIFQITGPPVDVPTASRFRSGLQASAQMAPRSSGSFSKSSWLSVSQIVSACGLNPLLDLMPPSVRLWITQCARASEFHRAAAVRSWRSGVSVVS